MSDQKQLQTFYFTYGNYEGYPFQGGWTMVIAYDYASAVAVFRAYHPDRSEGAVNCADIYFASVFEASGMGESGNLGKYCREIIGAFGCDD